MRPKSDERVEACPLSSHYFGIEILSCNVLRGPKFRTRPSSIWCPLLGARLVQREASLAMNMALYDETEVSMGSTKIIHRDKANNNHPQASWT